MSTLAKKTRLEMLKDDLCSMEPREFVMHWMFDVVPTMFKKQEAWTAWKLELSANLQVDAHSVVVIGSGCVGYSLNPSKAFCAFDGHSDVDVAVVSSYHFEVAWRFLRDVGAKIHSLPPNVRNAVKAHRDEYLFWGTIATDKILPYIEPFGPPWIRALSSLQNQSPVDGRELKVRLYRDSYSLVGYHENGVRKLRQKFLT